MDLINAMLWGLSGYDKALGRWVELRQHYADSPLMLGHIDAAVSVHIYHESEALMPDGLLPDMATEAEQRCPNAEITLRQVYELAEKDETKLHPAVEILIGGQRRVTFAVGIAAYALALGSFGNFGPAPWRRFVDIVNQQQDLADAK